MTDQLIVATGLVKRFADGTVAVDGVDLSIRRGEVYGLLGLNGAGKTTLLRCALGLVRPTDGTVRVFGRPPGHREALARTGALVESPAFYPHLSGRRNLQVLARFASLGDEAVDRVLGTVGLSDRAGSPFRTYSLGMKQRLGVAAALLKEPELLILDEPTNGLDAAGMTEMRELVRDLGHGQRTVVLSSHLLGEVEQVCDRVGVIHRGRLVAEGSVDELRARMGHAGVVVRATPVDKAVACADDVEGVAAVRADGETLHVTVDPGRASELAAALVHAGVSVHELRPVASSLEDIFMGLTAEEPSADTAGDPR